jgi:acetyltransferase-like isoleucine patch superfamily enzyme
MSGVLHTLRRWMRTLAISGETRALRARYSGERCFVDPTAQVLGWRQVRLGRNVVIGEHSWLNVNDRTKDDAAIEIGEDSFIGRRNFFNAGALIRLGPFCLTGVDCHFLGSDHRHETPFAPYIATGNETHQRIVVGANCWFGASVTVLGDVEIGFGSILGAGSVVTAGIPPFSVAVGNPARVIKRFDPARKAWVPVAEFPADAVLPTEADYIAEVRGQAPDLRQPKHAASSYFGEL